MKNKNLIIKALFCAMFIGNMFGGNENPLDENNHEQNDRLDPSQVSLNKIKSMKRNSPTDITEHTNKNPNTVFNGNDEQNAPLNWEQQELPYNRSNNTIFRTLYPCGNVLPTILYNPSSNRWFDLYPDFESGDDYENPEKNYVHIYPEEHSDYVIKEWMGEYFDGEPLIKLFEKFPNCYFCPQERNWYKFTINEDNKYVKENMTPEEEKNLNSILMRHFHPDPDYLKLILKQEEYDRKIYEELEKYVIFKNGDTKIYPFFLNQKEFYDFLNSGNLTEQQLEDETEKFKQNFINQKTCRIL